MRTREEGFTLVETAIASIVLTVGTLGFMATMAGTMQMDTQSADTVVALRAAQDQIDSLWNLAGVDFVQVHATFAGVYFAVEGLDPPPGRQAVGQVIIYDNEAEAKVALDLSLDIDLDRNGTANENVTKAVADLRFLPMRVHLEWQTPFGIRRHDLDTIIYNREVEE